MKTAWNPEKLETFEANLAKMFEEGKINAPLHLCGGNERELIDIFRYIEPRDYVFSTHRAHYHYLLKGGNQDKLIDEVLGLPTGMCKGIGRSMHLYDTSINFYSSAIIAGNCAIAAGVARAIAHEFSPDNPDRPHVYCFVGDGAEDSGHYVEALRFTAGRNLPITYILEDNDYSIDSTKEQRWQSYHPIEDAQVIRYIYHRKTPHVGIGKHVEVGAL